MSESTYERRLFVLRRAVAFAEANLYLLNKTIDEATESLITVAEMAELRTLVNQDDAAQEGIGQELAGAEEEIRSAQKRAEEILKPEKPSEI